MTERLYYSDSYRTEFRARVIEADPSGLRVYLDRTAFYPTSGGQPFDIGTLSGVRVVEVIDEERSHDPCARRSAQPQATSRASSTGLAASITCSSTPASTCFPPCLRSCIPSRLSASIWASTPPPSTSALRPSEPDQAARVEDRCAEIVAQARPVTVSYEDAASAAGLRKESQPAPAPCASSPSSVWTAAPAEAPTFPPPPKSAPS